MRQVPGPDEETVVVDDLKPGDVVVQNGVADTVVAYDPTGEILNLQNGKQRIVPRGQEVVRKRRP